MLSLTDPVSKLHLVKPKSEQVLVKLGVKTVADLLYYFPRDWQDRTEIKKISEIRPGEQINIRARVKQVANPGFPFRRVKITEALLEDDTGNVVAVWFNQPYIKNSLKVGGEYFFTGKAQLYLPRRQAGTAKKQTVVQLAHPTFEQVKEETIHVAGIIPEYRLSEGITQKQLRYWLKQSLGALTDNTDLIPQTIRTRLKLADINSAIRNIHFPGNNSALERARRRLAFEELFLFQLAFQSYKKTLKSLPAPAIPFDKNLVSRFVESLPFKLTGSQRLATWEILSDLAKPHPMNRLLEGEVGSGKTVVAGLAMLEAAAAGYQSVMLAPTEILALQHYETLRKLFEHTEIEIALWTRSHKVIQKSDVRGQKSENGNQTSDLRVPIVIGTHALLKEHLRFEKIGLLVVDEQHRFGVKQRAKLVQENSGLVPHLLSMTATPIPRTLALAFYGDLDISKLQELPMGRKKIITRLVSPENRKVAYEFVRKELQRGRQAYVIVPLVGEVSVIASGNPRGNPDETRPPGLRPSEVGQVASESTPRNDNLGEKKTVIAEAEKLRKIFPEFAIGILHGRMPGEEKKQIMQEFKENRLHILVSTTVVEVGVDVPNATIIIIENAERFGLATLHQLRGRVGRGQWQSLCILFTENSSQLTGDRLQAVVTSTDGFALAEIDLRLRGAGEILGTKQSGFMPFKIASLDNQKLIEIAKAEALALLDQDPALAGYPELSARAAEISKEAHLE